MTVEELCDRLNAAASLVGRWCPGPHTTTSTSGCLDHLRGELADVTDPTRPLSEEMRESGAEWARRYCSDPWTPAQVDDPDAGPDLDAQTVSGFKGAPFT